MKELSEFENKIICGTVESVLKEIPSNSLDLCISSPPYNVGIEYDEHDDNMEWKKYEEWMSVITDELFRTLRDGGRVCWNIPSFSSRQNLYQLFYKLFEKSGFKQYSEIIWDKKQISSRTAWGSFCSPSEPNILPRHEYVLIFYKNTKNFGKGKTDISKEEFIKWTDGMWEINPETKSGHPAPFPEELPERLMKMFSYPESIVVDPFGGSGTVAYVAKKFNRRFIHIDISKKYCSESKKRVKSIPSVSDVKKHFDL